jgi:hypothetical protein
LLILAEAAIPLADGDPDMAELALSKYQEVLHGQRKDPVTRSLIERALGEVEVLKAFRLPHGPLQKQHWLRAREHFQRSWNLMNLCRLPRCADATWSRADMLRALTHLHLFNAGAALGAMNTGVDAFVTLPSMVNLHAAIVELLLRLQVAEEAPSELRAIHKSVVDKLNQVQGDAAWLEATGENRTVLKLIEGRIDFLARHQEYSLADALAHYKEVFRTESSLALCIRALRWMAEAMQEVPALAAGVPGILELADRLNEEREMSENTGGVIVEDDKLYERNN